MSEVEPLCPPTPTEGAILDRVLREIRRGCGGRLTLHFKTGQGAEAVTWERVETGRAFVDA